MVKSEIKPAAYWESWKGRAELFERMQNVLEVGRYEIQYSRPDPALFHRRMDQIAAMGKEAGHDVVVAFGDHSDSQLVRHVMGGYKTLFAGVSFALGTNVDPSNPRASRAVPADLELGKPARFHCEHFNLEMEVYQIEGIGLTGETYRNVNQMALYEIFRQLSGKKEGPINVGILTSPAINTVAFEQLVRDAAMAVHKDSKVVYDETIAPRVAFHQDEEQALSLKRMFNVTSAALDVALACSSPNVPETLVAGYAELAMRILGSIANEWDPLVGAGAHNDATIARALNIPLPETGVLNLGFCPYNFVPSSAAPTSRRVTYMNAGHISELPAHIIQAYRGLEEAYLAVKQALENACAQEGPVKVASIDQAAIDALARHTITYPDKTTANLADMQTYSSVHGSWSGECGLQQRDKKIEEEGGDMAFGSAKLLPSGICTWGHDLGIGGQGHKTPYLVIEDMSITRKPGNYELLCIVPIALDRILQMTGTGIRTPEMYKDPFRRTAA